MKTDELYNKFLETMKDRTPPRINLANLLMDLLCIGREAVYRRLRGEVPFSFSEIAVISKEFDISIDHIMSSDSPANVPLKVSLINYSNLFETDFQHISHFTSNMKLINENIFSELGIAAGYIPHNLYLKYNNLTRLIFLKWQNQYEQDNCRIFLSKIEIPKKLTDIYKEYITGIQKIKSSCLIWDKMMFQRLINDINYFIETGLISSNDLILIKKELLQMMYDLEKIAESGKYPNTGNKVQMYICETNIETIYTYLDSKRHNIVSIKAFALDGITSRDQNSLIKMKQWLNALKNMSVFISENAVSQRMKYFESQRALVTNLL